MNQSETPKPGVHRRGFFAGLLAGVGIAALAAGARKVRAAAPKGRSGPVLYRRTEETERYFKTMF